MPMKLVRFLAGAVAAILVGDAAVAADGAKDLFYKQMSNPTVQINTGVQYWIELKRNGRVTRVNNKFDFRSGDRIKIHVKSNIDGFAYVILKEGSEGEHAVLFPDAKLRDDNRIKAGIDYALPGDGYLMFDSHPGNEKLMLVLSRGPVRADDYLKTNKPRVLVASREPGAKDLVPGSAVVSFDDNNQIADLQVDESTPIASASSHASTTGPAIATASDTINPTPAAGTPAGNFVTTVVERNPQVVLALDIVLSHKP